MAAKQQYEESLKNIHKEKEAFLKGNVDKKEKTEDSYKNELLRELGLKDGCGFQTHYLEDLLQFCEENNTEAQFLIWQLSRAEGLVTFGLNKRFYNYGLPLSSTVQNPQSSQDFFDFAIEVLNSEAYGNNANRNFVATLLEQASELAIEEEKVKPPCNPKQKMSIAYKFVLGHLYDLYETHSNYWWNHY